MNITGAESKVSDLDEKLVLKVQMELLGLYKTMIQFQKDRDTQ